MWPLTFCCSPVDRRAGLAGPQGSRSMLKEQRYAGHMAPGASFWQGSLSIYRWTVYLMWVSMNFYKHHLSQNNKQIRNDMFYSEHEQVSSEKAVHCVTSQTLYQQFVGVLLCMHRCLCMLACMCVWLILEATISIIAGFNFVLVHVSKRLD